MAVVTVKASRTYDVVIERGILAAAGERILAASGAKKAAVISDDRVFPIYGDAVMASLRSAGLEAVSYVFPNGESSKNLATYGAVMNFLASEGLKRSDVLVALGGGVVGDITGFAAATYLRGVKYVQIPTTLLAAVDSSVGGKTAVDLERGKNLAGAFHQPSLVLCDPDTLGTLSEDVYRDGCSEVIKYGLLGDAEFFRSLNDTAVKDQPEAVIERCVTMKRDIVAEDEYDTGKRQLLNLGHSFGHAIEAESGYTLGHGHCVAIGMAVISKAAAAKGYCGADVPETMEEILKKYSLPTRCPYSAERLMGALLSDKKNYGGTMRLIVPYNIGDCRIVAVPAAELGDWLRAGGVE